MNTLKFLPEGWNIEEKDINKETIEKYIKTNETLQAKVEQCDEKFNLHINLGNGIEGIIPREEVECINLDENGVTKTNLCTGKINKYVQFKVKGITDDNVAILSRKEVQQEVLDWVKNDLNEGEKVTGIVKNIKPYGAFIEVGGGVVGLAHIEDLSIARIKSPAERLKVGQKVDIVVKSIDKTQGKLILSYKETLGSWNENASKFEVGDKVTGIVRETEKNKNGIFIELTPNLVGMAEYVEGLQYGQKVNVYVKKIDTNRKKIKLNII